MTRRAFILTNPDAIELGAEPLDKLRIALDRMFGLSPQAIERAVESRLFSEHARARLLREPRDWNYLDGPTLATHLRWSRAHPGLRAASFTEIRNELDASWPASVHGRVREAQVSTDFANALGNTLRRLLLSAYAEPLYGEETISRPGSTPDLRPQQLVGVNVGADIPTVDLEASNYPEAPKLAERNIGSFPVVLTGEIITISRKTIINDDINLVSRLISDKGRAARRTLARAIWAPWIANATYGEDGLAWFHANHSNAQSSAISETEVIAGIRKLLDQTQPGSAEKLGTRARPGSLYLDVPHALWDAAYKLNQTTASALYHLFGAANEFINVNPLFTDANDWGIHRSSDECESITVRYLNGREEPEFLLADLPNADQLLIGDRFQYKLRAEYFIALAEFRGAMRATV